MQRPTVLVICDYFLPGYLAGGPIRSIANIVDHMGDTFNFRIITRNHDLGDSNPYKGIEVDKWHQVGKAEVLYVSSSLWSILKLLSLVRETSYDLLYLNSFFSIRFTTAPLILRLMKSIPSQPCLIAPRGELSYGALAIKSCQKILFIRFMVFMGLYKGVHWQASSFDESTDIVRALAVEKSRINIALDLPPNSPVKPLSLEVFLLNECDETLKLVFLSRISPMKNLDFLLKVLCHVTFKVDLAIYGPKEDCSYWDECAELIRLLPKHVSVKISGVVAADKVIETFARYDCFVFPTRGENFGHVILESLIAGTPVMLSDQTPWQDDGTGAISVLPLDIDSWIASLEALNASRANHSERRQAAIAYAKTMTQDKQVVEINKKLFMSLIEGEDYSYVQG